MYIKESIRIVCGENFRSFGRTLTEIRLLDRLDGLHILLGFPIVFKNEGGGEGSKIWQKV